MQPASGRTQWIRRGTAALALVLLLAAMLADTTFQSEGEAAGGDRFDAASDAKGQFPKLAARIKADATPITTLATAVDENAAAAGRKYGQDLGAGSFAIPVSAQGTVGKVDANFAELSVAGLRKPDVVRIPLGLALNGAPVRDATGTIKYGDFRDQTDYQEVANQLKLIMAKQVIAPFKRDAKQGAKVTVTGAFATGGPAHSFIVQPVAIEAG